MYFLDKLYAFALSWMIGISLFGCATTSSNMRIGNSMDYVGLKEQREANLTVKLFDKSPNNAQILGSVEASRCHRYTGVTEPTENILITDLKISAYAQGAGGITDLKITKSSGFTSDCWYILDGRATMIKLR